MATTTGTTRTRRARRPLALGVGAALAVGAAVVAVDVAGAPGAAAASLTPFGSCEELTGWYRDAALEQVTAWGVGGGYGGPMVAVMEDSAAGADSAGGADQAASARVEGTGEAVGSSATGTNVQEEGVDEPSRVKLADGRAHVLAGDRLVVVDTGTGAVLGSVGLGTDPESGAWSSDLLLLGDRVVVLGSASLPAPADAGAAATASGLRIAPDLMPTWGGGTTTATTVDVSDPAAPVVVGRTEVEGDYVSARAVDGVVRVVTTSRPVLPFVDPWLVQQSRTADAPVDEGMDVAVEPVEPGGEAEAEALAHNERVVRDATAADWLPDLVQRDADGTVTGTTTLPCDAVAHPSEGAGTATLTVLALDPAAAEPLLGTTSVSADGSVVYASTDRLYVATTRGGWLWGAPGEQERLRTELHGFATTGPGTDYLGSGSVDGWLLGSWAMDASDGYLRVGTTRQGPDVPAGAPGDDGDLSMPAPTSGDTSSSVVVLQETADGLVEAGRVDGLGPGEQIRSLRWADDLVVVVTFEQTDPLYTVDLGDPTAPRVLGELKVTGYSGYLHPLGDGLLLGVGQAGDDQGTLLGAKVETYDLRDLGAPRAVDDLVWPSASSPVEWDSRLFTYLPQRRTAVLALERFDEATGAASSGLVAVSVGTDGGLQEAGLWMEDAYASTGGLASDGDVVVVQREAWVVSPDGTSEAPRRTLAVLDAGDLTVRTVVDLG